MKVIDTAIIGLGQIGYAYDGDNKTTRTHVGQIKKQANFKLIAACDSDVKKKDKLKNNDKNYTKIYSNYETMLDSHKIDLLVLAVPSGEQKKIVDYALSRNIKNFIIEKPLLSNNDEIRDVLNKVVEVKGKIYVNYPRTWESSFFIDFKHALSERVLHINAFISSDLKENGCHLIDLLFRPLGSMVKLLQNLAYLI